MNKRLKMRVVGYKSFFGHLGRPGEVGGSKPRSSKHPNVGSRKRARTAEENALAAKRAAIKVVIHPPTPEKIQKLLTPDYEKTLRVDRQQDAIHQRILDQWEHLRRLQAQEEWEEDKKRRAKYEQD